NGIEAPYLQLVLERLWERERALDSRELRLATFRELGGARAVVREHVQGALDRLPLAEQEAAARVVRQLVTPSGRKLSHEPADLAEYADVEDDHLRRGRGVRARSTERCANAVAARARPGARGPRPCGDPGQSADQRRARAAWREARARPGHRKRPSNESRRDARDRRPAPRRAHRH